ncbi:MAG TPA: hypothetical protein VGG28_03980 [Kofleriaceae bacterium]
MHRFVVALALVACSSPPLVLRGSPTLAALPPSFDAMFDVPPIGDVRGATLADGWPVWLVRHADGSLDVFSAVVRRVRSGATLFDGDRALVRWQPRERRFVAADVAYDELGRPTGYVDPRELERPDANNLDAFDYWPDGHHIAIGLIRPGAAHADPDALPWDHEPHVARETPLLPGEREVTPPVAISDAAAAPVGSYAIVRGALVQSTEAAPRVCGCGGCAPSAPLALGVRAITVSARTDHAELATMLVRREPDGLAIIATTIAGACPT